jgi:hypothetical protein
MRKVALLAVLGAIGVLSVGAVAVADDDDGSGRNAARLNGYQEVSSVSTTGFGSFRLDINHRDQTADYVLSYRDVETPVTQAHIHFAQRSVNGPVHVFLCANGAFRTGQRADLPTCPASSGTVEGSFSAADIVLGNPDRGIEAMDWDELIAAIKVGHTYANVHSTKFPGGEIRGQINDRDQKEYTGPPPFALGGGDEDD